MTERPRTYGPRYNARPEDPTRCIETVSDGYSVKQCSNKRKEGPGLKYCGIHNPDKIAAKDEARRKKYEAAREQRWDVVMRRQNLALREALKPFAEFAKMFEEARELKIGHVPVEPDAEWYCRETKQGVYILTPGMFDQARKVIEGKS